LVIVSTAILALLSSVPAWAGKQAADECLKTKIWDRYGDGWQIRASAGSDLALGETQYYRVTLLKGQRYQVITCSDDNVADLDILLYDNKGVLIHRDGTEDREPVLAYEAPTTGVYYAVLYMRALKNTDQAAHASMALIHN
jgi:hypothetical protein